MLEFFEKVTEGTQDRGLGGLHLGLQEDKKLRSIQEITGNALQWTQEYVTETVIVREELAEAESITSGALQRSVL